MNEVEKHYDNLNKKTVEEHKEINENTETLYNTINLDKLTESFSDILTHISGLKTYISTLQNNMKELEKNTKKHIKTLEKEIKKRQPKTKKKPSGFAQPTNITSELCSFLDKPQGTKMARTEVTQYLIKYISDHKLQNDDNKKYICPDDKLSKLLNLSNDDELTYFNIQGYMNQHFMKNNK